MLDSRNRQAAWSLARALIKSGEAEKSEQILKVAVALDPDYNAASLGISDAAALNFLANEALSRKQFTKAIILLENVLEQSPGSEEANFGLGTARRARNNLDAAQSAFQSVIAINPTDIKARSLLRYIQHRQMNVVRVGAESQNTQHQN
jgi:tetratricopeptide (TPR) repeat protein